MQEDTINQKSSDSYIGPDHQLPAQDPEPHRSKGFRTLIWIVILLAFGVLFWVVINHHEEKKATPRRRGFVGTVTITTATAKKGNIGVYLDAIGTVTPVYTNSITSQATGQVQAVYYREGQMVQKGQPLLDIDSRPYQAQLLQAQGALERDTNLLAQAKMDLERYREASRVDAIAKQTLEDQEKIVLQYEGTVKADQGTVQYDQVQVSFCHLVAPISGRVGLRLVDPGNVVQANSTTPLVVITQLQPITVVFTIAQDSIGQVVEQMRHGTALRVDAYDRDETSHLGTGKLLTLDNQIDTATGTVKLRALFANTTGVLFPNLFVNTRLLVKTLDGMTLIPAAAIQYNGDVAYVYLIQNGVAHIHQIKPGVSDSGITAVQGINPGDVVSTSSFEKLQNNSPVVLSKTPIPANTSGNNTP